MAASGLGGAALRRHDLVRAEPAAWAALLAGRPDLDGIPHLSGWAAARRPLIVRRRLPDEASPLVPLGLPLPPADGKLRIALALPPGALAPHPSPTLGEAAPAAPAEWRPTLDALTALGARYGLAPRPFGALLWQALTGLAYLAPASDLDLLWPLPAGLPRGFLDDLDRLATGAPMRLDGEVILPDGAGLHWRELRDALPGGGGVLAKHVDRLELRAVADLLDRAAA